ncbi:MAG: TonB-dependent receptor [Myxococcota bacterium]
MRSIATRRTPWLWWVGFGLILTAPVRAQDEPPAPQAPRSDDAEAVDSPANPPANDDSPANAPEDVVDAPTDGEVIDAPPADAPPAAEGSPADDSSDPETLHPPHLLTSPPPEYPEGREEEGVHPTVLVRLTVTPEGEVRDVVVEHSAGADFDEKAMEAVRGWTFEPARRGETPVSSRIAVAVHFQPPDLGLPHVGDTHDPQDAPHAEIIPPSANQPLQVAPATADENGFGATAEVDAEKLRAEGRGAGDFTVDKRILNAGPANTANDLLQRAPGLYVANVEGDAAGAFFYLRGFNAEHGQDIELKLGEVPLNQPSNIHGQGYSYLGFIVPEAVRNLRVIEGVYDPAQGDFAVAGTVEFDMGVEQRGVYAKSEIGSFRTFRQVGIFAPKDKDPDTFGAFQVRRSDGFGENRDGLDASGMFQVGFGKEAWRFRVHGAFWGARYNSAGVLRLDDIESGDVGFYDVYPFATARAQNAFNAGAIVGVGGEHRGKNDENTSFDIYLQFLDFRIQQNFTGFLQTSQVAPNFFGRGDLIEQRDRRIVVGGKARHRTARFKPAEWAQGTIEMGLSGRFDFINPQQQNLIAATENQTWDERVDANIFQGDVGIYVDLDWDFTQYLNFKGGVRADALFFEVEDRLLNFIPLFRPANFIEGFRRSAAGIVAGPRLALTGKPFEWFDIIAAYGEGFRSPQANTLVDGEVAPFAKVRSADLGVKFRIGPEEQLNITLTGYRTWLNKDVFFEATEGRLENIGPTSRTGFVFYAVTNPLPWLVGALSVTYVRAVLDGPPPRTVENPTPQFDKGDLLPFIPPWIVRFDIGATEELVDLGNYPLIGHLGFGFTYLSARPLPFQEFADPFSVLDASARLSWRFLEIGFQAYNLINKQYAGNEFAFVSDWDPDAVPSRIPARHISAGRPRTLFFTIGIRL